MEPVRSHGGGGDTSLLFFVGEYSHNLDKKRRLTIPSGWRSRLGEPHTLFVLPDFHQPCLNVFPVEAMRSKLERLREQASMGNEQAMRFCTELGAVSDVVEWDANGRIRVSDKLLDFARVGERVVLVGALDKMQLWSPDVRPESAPIDQAGLREWGKGIDF